MSTPASFALEPLLPPAELAAQFEQQRRAGTDPSELVRTLLPRMRVEPRNSKLAYARAFLDAGLAGVMAALLQDAVLFAPNDAELVYWLGNAYRMCGAHDSAEQVFRNSLQNNPGDERTAQALAYMLRDAGRLDAACQVILRLGEARGGGVEAALRDIRFLHGCRRFSEAAALCERELARGTTDPRLLFLAGEMAMTLGRFDLARERLLAAISGGLDLNAWSGIWLFLAACQRYADGAHPDLERFRSAMQDSRLGEASRAAAAFAYGKACDDLHRFEEAARAFDQANALARPRHPWSAEQWNQFVDACLSRPSPSPSPATGDSGIVPVFVVGLPRSGTTLVAELLGRHPQVCNRGERAWLPFLNQQLASGAAGNNPAALRMAAATYLAQLRQDDAPARWYIDKNPLNFRHLDLIAAMLPGARVIHCRRDRRDTALSIWMQHFAHQDNNYAYAWDDIAAFAAGEERLMQHWKRTLPVPILTVDYEKLAQDPAQSLRELAAFLGLPEQDLLATPSKENSAIATSSVWQARQPVYRSSVGRWQPYAPLIPGLAALNS